MNRRSFLKVAGLLPVLLALPSGKIEEDELGADIQYVKFNVAGEEFYMPVYGAKARWYEDDEPIMGISWRRP